MHIMAGSVIQSKLYKKSMLHYNNKDQCLKIPNLYIGGDAKSDLKKIK